MFCQNCGASIEQHARFCAACGKVSAITNVAGGTRKKLTPARMFLYGALAFVSLSVIAAMLTTVLSGPSNNSTPSSSSSTEPSDVNGPLPRYRIFKFKIDVPTAYVVPVDTSDGELKNLLWFFRKHVRAGELKVIGITQPTTREADRLGYAKGMLVVFRGEKCAGEDYVSDERIDKGDLGPCGYGDHSAAVYQWGVDGDPAKDSGSITDKNGDVTEIFNYKDNWNPSLKGPEVIDQKMREALKEKDEEWEPMQRAAVTIANTLNDGGISVHASANFNQPKELDFHSPLFKSGAFRNTFINDALPKARPELCKIGFESFRILQQEGSDEGKSYPLHCQ